MFTSQASMAYNWGNNFYVKTLNNYMFSCKHKSHNPKGGNYLRNSHKQVSCVCSKFQAQAIPNPSLVLLHILAHTFPILLFSCTPKHNNLCLFINLQVPNPTQTFISKTLALDSNITSLFLA